MVEIEIENLNKINIHKKKPSNVRSNLFKTSPRGTFYNTYVEPNITENDTETNYIYKLQSQQSQGKSFRLRQTMSDFRKPGYLSQMKTPSILSPRSDFSHYEQNFNLKKSQENYHENSKALND